MQKLGHHLFLFNNSTTFAETWNFIFFLYSNDAIELKLKLLTRRRKNRGATYFHTRMQSNERRKTLTFSFSFLVRFIFSVTLLVGRCWWESHCTLPWYIFGWNVFQNFLIKWMNKRSMWPQRTLHSRYFGPPCFLPFYKQPPIERIIVACN